MSRLFLDPPPLATQQYAKGVLDPQWQAFYLKTQHAITVDLAPADASYWLKTSNPLLTNAANLGALASGHLSIMVLAGSATPTSSATIPTVDLSGILQAAQFPALTGDVTTIAGALATTLANSGVVAATYGSANQSAQVTIDAKGRVTAASNVSIVAAVANAIAITNDTTTNASMYLTWAPTGAGNRALSISDTKLTFNPSSGLLTATAFAGNLTGNVTGNVTGNASTSTILQTARAINGVNFDGSAAITVTAAAGTLTGTTLAAGVTASSLTSVGVLSTLEISGGAAGSTFTALILRNAGTTNSTGADFWMLSTSGGAGNASGMALFRADVTGASSASELKLFTNAGNAITQALTISSTQVITFNQYAAGTPTFVAGDKYLVVNASGVIHVSALGPAS